MRMTLENKIRMFAVAAIAAGAMYAAGCEEEVSECCENLECNQGYVCSDMDEKDKKNYSSDHCEELESGEVECCRCAKLDDNPYDNPHGPYDNM
jgi:hypothetical protein